MLYKIFKRRVGNSGIEGQLGDGQSWDIDNLQVIRAFEDRDGSEAGFILTHVAMVANTGESSFAFSFHIIILN